MGLGEKILAGFIGGAIGFVAGYSIANVKAEKSPQFSNIIGRYRLVATWQGNSQQLQPVYVGQEISGDEIWFWLAQDGGIWAVTKMFPVSNGISFEISRLAWAKIEIYRGNTKVAEFQEVTQSNRVFDGYYSTTEQL